MRFMESHLQQSMITYFRYQYPKYNKLLFSIPNGAFLAGTKEQRIRQWHRLEREGAITGAADLFLSIPRQGFNGFYIEVKTPKGTQSKEQREFMKLVREMGYKYEVVKTIDEFINQLKQYL